MLVIGECQQHMFLHSTCCCRRHMPASHA
jgi:hypothetical protein